jgi:Uma2 family endonuclease
MSQPFAKPRPTYDDVCKLPEHVIGEILDGQLFATPRPRVRHARVSTVLGAALVGPFWQMPGGPGGWRFLFEPEVHLQDDIIVPDLAGWRQHRLPEMPDEPFLTLAPDWVCEVISASTEALDRIRKTRIYARESVSHLWFADPTLRTLEIFRLEAGRWTLVAAHANGDVIRAEPFDAIELEMARLWSDAPTAP